jgi:hypothetical protein
MKPVWSDTWVFRHPVTSDKNFRSQNISFTFFVKKSWVFRNLSLPTSDTVFRCLWPLRPVVQLTLRSANLLHYYLMSRSKRQIRQDSFSVINNTGAKKQCRMSEVTGCGILTNCGYYRITILSSVSGDGVKVQLLHSGYFWYSSAHITLRSTTLLPVLWPWTAAKLGNPPKPVLIRIPRFTPGLVKGEPIYYST